MRHLEAHRNSNKIRHSLSSCRRWLRRRRSGGAPSARRAETAVVRTGGEALPSRRQIGSSSSSSLSGGVSIQSSISWRGLGVGSWGFRVCPAQCKYGLMKDAALQCENKVHGVARRHIVCRCWPRTTCAPCPGRGYGTFVFSLLFTTAAEGARTMNSACMRQRRWALPGAARASGTARAILYYTILYYNVLYNNILYYDTLDSLD